MTEETKQTEVASTNTGATEPQLSQEQPKDATKIAVDIAPGVSIELDIDTAKKVIAHRDSKTKGYKELESKLKSAEATAKQEADKALLMKAMKDSDATAVEEQVSAKYRDKIKTYEDKIFKSEIKSLLANEQCLNGALDDATNLAMQGVEVTLKDSQVMVGDKTASDYVKEFIKTRPHLVAVQATQQGKKVGVTPVVPKVNGDFQKFTQTLFTKK